MNRLIIISLLVLLFSCRKAEDDPAGPNKKAQWIEHAFAALQSGTYSRVKAISWWQENYGNTYLAVNSSPQSLDAYREAVANSLFITQAVFDNGKLIPSPEGMYHSAFPDFGGTEDIVTARRIKDFENLVGKEITWAYFSNNWLDDVRFPAEAVSVIHQAGKVPFIRLMPRSVFEEGAPDPVYTMQKIIDGDFDTQLTQWAVDAAQTGIPLLAEFGTEVNGDWFSWNGFYNGGGETTGYGDPALPDGPERFCDAYRHIIQICRANGAVNITWFFHVDADSEPATGWNAIENYYPGDDYIDWLGVSVYGPMEKGDDYREFAETLDQIYPALTRLSAKPVAILEFGITEIE